MLHRWRPTYAVTSDLFRGSCGEIIGTSTAFPMFTLSIGSVQSRLSCVNWTQYHHALRSKALVGCGDECRKNVRRWSRCLPKEVKECGDRFDDRLECNILSIFLMRGLGVRFESITTGCAECCPNEHTHRRGYTISKRNPKDHGELVDGTINAAKP